MGSLSYLQISWAMEAEERAVPLQSSLDLLTACRGLQEHSWSTSHTSLDPGAV